MKGGVMKKGNRRFIVCFVTGFWLLAIVSGGIAFAAEKKIIKLSIGCGHPLAGEHVRIASDFFAKEIIKRVDEQTPYRLEISEQWGGSVAKLGEELEAVEIGLLDMALVITPFEPTKLFIHNYSYNIPFFTKDPILINQITKKLYEKFPVFKETYQKYNQIWLGGLGSTGDYGLITTFAIHEAEDVKGRKLTAAGPNLPWISGVGAIPVQGNLNEWYTGIQTGVYDGAVMYPGPSVGFKLYEVAKHFTETHFGAIGGTSALTINKNSWNKLPKEVQKILMEVGSAYSLKEPEYILVVQNRSLKIMKDAGVSIFDLPFSEQVKWAKGLVNQPKKFAQEADAKGYPGTAIMKAAIELGKEKGVKMVRNWMEE
jgi:C4-dicarboxylate-binding protein DctP